MALIKCSECGQMISDKATKCPKCGSPPKEKTVLHHEDVASDDMPVYEEEENHTSKWLYVVIALLLVAVAGGGYYLFKPSDKNTIKDDTNEHLADSSAIFVEAESNEPTTVAKDSEIKVEGYKVTGKAEDLNLRLCVNVDGRLVRTDIGDGLYILNVLDEHDYDGDGRNECLLYGSMGGAAPYGYSIAYYNSTSGKIEEVEFDSYEEPTAVTQNGKWYFTIKEGINTKMYVFDKGKLNKVEDKHKNTSKPLKTYTFKGVFGMEEIDEQEMNIEEYFDMDDDGNLETLEFHANKSHIWGWGTLMSLNIHWNDGRLVETNMTTDKIAILSSKSNGLHDLLFNDKYLCKWNGKEYVEAE